MDLDSQLSHTTVPRLSLHTWNLSQSKGTDVTKPQVDLFEGTLAILWLHTCPAHCLLPICSRSKKWKWFKDQETQLNSYFSETLAKQKPPKISSIFCFICSLASNQVTFFEVSPTDLSKKNIWKWWVKGLFETILLSVQIKTPEKKRKMSRSESTQKKKWCNFKFSLWDLCTQIILRGFITNTYFYSKSMVSSPYNKKSP